MHPLRYISQIECNADSLSAFNKILHISFQAKYVKATLIVHKNVASYIMRVVTKLFSCDFTFLLSSRIFPKRSIKTNKFSKEDQEQFLSVYPEIIDITCIEPFNKLPDFKLRTKSMLEYNLAPKQNANGLLTLIAYKMIVKPEKITEENMRLAAILGWCLRLVSMSPTVTVTEDNNF